jgi:hypothetical protein
VERTDTLITMHPRLLVPLAVLVVAAPAHAGPVDGKLTVPSGGVPRPPPRTRGFLEPVGNPHLPAREHDPLPAMVVVLEGAAVAPAGGAPAQATWDLLGDSFSRPVIAVHVGSELRIRNRGHGTPILTAVGQPDLIAKKPLNPTGEITFNVGTEPRVIEIVDETTPHVRGRIVVLASRWFTTPDASGKFAFADVPPGAWTLRVFYGTGWIDRPDDKLAVDARRLTVNPTLPRGLPVKAP